MASGKRRFGSIRKLPSGRFQARYRQPDGTMKAAPHPFMRKSEAAQWLSVAESQMMRDEWIDPSRGKVHLKEYAERWIDERPGLRPRTVQLYRWTLKKHIVPELGKVEVGQLDTQMIRAWRSKLIAEGVSLNGAAKAYRLLRAILMTAWKEDEIIRRNPCRIPGADKENAEERPTLTLGQLMNLVKLMPERYRALVLLTTFASLRWGEVTALERKDIDLKAGTVRVRQAYVEIRGQGLVLGPPKSKAGKRTVSFPRAILPVVTEHLDTYVKEGAASLVFTTSSGRPIWRGNFNKIVKWMDAVGKVGATGLHFHDLRHSGNTMAAQTGTSLRDLMTRMGHDNPRAALIYQHATSDADRAIAVALDAVLKQHDSDDQHDKGDAA